MRPQAQRSPSESEIYDPDSQMRPLNLIRGTTNSNPEMRHRSTSDKTVIHGPPDRRRISSPQIDRPYPDVITASLKIPVPSSTGGATFGLELDDKDIPFIEDNDSSRGDDSNRSNASTLKAVPPATNPAIVSES